MNVYVYQVETLCDLYIGFVPCQLSCLDCLVGKSDAWRADGCVFKSANSGGSQFISENDCFSFVYAQYLV